MMGSQYAGPATIEKVKRCILSFPQDSIIIPHRIHKSCGTDENQVVGALEKIAPTPGKWVDIGGKSKLTRCRAWRRWIKINEWFYDEPGDEYLPVFPYFHDRVSKSFPLIHDATHGRALARIRS